MQWRDGDQPTVTLTEEPAWLPVSAMQRGVWLDHQLAPDSPAYTLCGRVRLDGPVNEVALQAALDAIVARHAALRTTFEVRAGEVVQVVHPPRPGDLTVIDLSGQPPHQQPAAADALCAEEAQRPFDLTRLPLWRTTLIRLAGQTHLLVIARHHLVSDGQSMTLWFEALDAGYAAAMQGVCVTSQPLPAQYADYARSQEDWLQGAACARQTAYWRRQLAGAPRGLLLTPDYPRPSARGIVGVCEERSMPAHLLRRLTTMAHAHGATPYMALVAVFMLVLHRYGGTDDVVVRSPIDARDRVIFEPLIGFLINSVVLRTRLIGDPTFTAWLDQVRSAILEASANRDVPFPHVVEALRGSDGTAPPLQVPIEFAYQAWSARRQRLLGLQADIRTVETGAVRSTLALCVDQIGDEGWLRAEYRTDVFKRATIVQLLRSFVAVAEQVTADPARRLSAVATLAPADRRAVLLDVNRTQRAGTPSSLPDWLARTPVSSDAPAVIVGAEDPDGGTTWTHGALRTAVAAEAARLYAAGVGTATPVAVCLPRGIDLIIALWAIVEVGGALVPLDPEAPVARRQAMLADCGARVVIADAAAAAWVGPTAKVLPPDDRAAGHHPPPPPTRPDPEDAAYVMYTSGSTGPPKGVVITQRGLCNRLRWMLDTFGFTASDRIVQKTPCTFDASVWEWVAPRLVGGCVVVAGPNGHRDPASLVRTMRAGGVTILQVVPSLLHALLEEPGLRACTALRQVFCAGEVLPVALARRWRQLMAVPLCNTYGPTEAAIDVTAWRIETDEPEDSVPIGRPIDNARAYVLEAGGAPAPIGVVGDLYVAGAGLARGYLRGPALTADRFVPCPFGEPGERMYRTGDRARRRADGALVFAGRADSQVKLRGVRIEPEAIEALLDAQPGVGRSVVVVIDVHGTPTVTACVVAEPDVVAALPAAIAAILPAEQQPGRYVELAAVPLTPHGKVDRAAVARWAREAPPAPATVPRKPPRDAMDIRLARLWEEVLGLAVDDCATSFFALGGHSLLTVRLLARLEQDLGLTIALADFFEEPTIAGMRRRSRPLPSAPPAPAAAPVTLSAAQQRLWFLDQWGLPTGVYTVAEAYRLEGPLDIAALRTSVAAVIQRHEVLRTRVVTDAGRPRAVVDSEPEIEPLRIVDLRSTRDEEQAVAAASIRKAAAGRTIDLRKTPLLRVTLIQLTETAAEVVFALPHLISDVASGAVLRAELAAHYRAARRGDGAGLPPLTVQYRDYVACESARLTPSRLSEGVQYWRTQLADVPVLPIPSDRPRTAGRSAAGAVATVIVPSALASALTRLSHREGVTPFMLFLAAFQTLLCRYSGQHDVAVGTVISQRHRPEWDPLIGLFLNTLVLRTDLTGDPPFRTLLARVRAVALGAYAHQDVPFDRVVEALQPPRDGRHAPLCQVMFVHQHAPEADWALDDVHATALGVDNGGAKFDLTLIITEYAAGLAVTAEYATALFRAETITRLLGHYVTLLQGIVDAPGSPISRLPLVDATERARLIASWSGSGPVAAAEPPPRGLVRELESAARANAECLAVVCGDQRITYGALDDASNQLARHLRGLGVGPDVCVGLCVELSIDFVLGILGILKAGGAYMPLDPLLPSGRIGHALEATRASFLIAADATRIPETRPRQTRVLHLDELLTQMRGYSTAPLNIEYPDARLAYVVLTSGSTGAPKAAAVEHRGLANLISWYLSFGFSPADRTLIISSPAFDLTQKNFFAPLMAGSEIHLPSWHLADYRAASRAIADAGITMLNCTPTTFYPLLDESGTDAFASLRSLRHLFLGGEPIAAERLLPWMLATGPATTVVNTYGPTECTDVVSSHVYDPAQPTETGRVAIGRPVPRTSLAVLDRHLEPVPDNVEGELYIGGIAVGRGYLNRPRLTAERFFPDPFSRAAGARLYRTGDRVRRRRDGTLEFLGRFDRQIKLRGFRIEPGEIETLLESHPAVSRAVVTTHEPGPDDTRLIAHIVTNRATATSPPELRAHLSRSLPEFMLPSAYVVIAAMPLTRSGKIDYSNLPPPSDEDWAREAGFVAPATANEVRLSEIWSSLLGVGALSINDDFFAAGGHSLLAAQLAAQIGQAFGLDLPLHIVFEYATISRLAEYIDAVMVASDVYSPLVPDMLDEKRV